MSQSFYKIESGVPLPSHCKSSALTATLLKMEVGDSFVCSRTEANSIGYRARNKTMTGRKFTQHKISEAEVRVWRVE